ALLNMVRLPHQLALGGIILLGQAVPLLPPVCQGLQVWPGSRELRRQVRAESRGARRHLRLVRPWGSLEAIRDLRGRRQQRLMDGEVLRTLRGWEDRRWTLVDLRYTYGRGRGLVLGLRCSAPGCGAGRSRSWCGRLALGLAVF